MLSDMLQDRALLYVTGDMSPPERDVWLASRRHRFAYGLACVALSLGLGWAAAVAFRRRF